MSIRTLGLVIIGGALWACSGKSERVDGDGSSGGGGGSGTSGGSGATGGTGAQGGTGTGGKSGSGGTAGSAGSGAGGTGGVSGSGSGGPCRGLKCDQTTCTMGQCTQMPCADGASTTVSGVVYDPSGYVPLYNALVYVPNGPLPLPPMPEGASCAVCDLNALDSVTGTLTDTTGRFVLPDMPVGSDVPVVIQVGKWRRQITVPNVVRCVDTPLTNNQETRLPRTKAEGDIPRIAITTGGADSLECLLRRMGVDDSEFTSNIGQGRIHLYAGTESGTENFPTTMLDSGEALPHADTLWSTVDALDDYDLVVLSCEGDATEDEKPAGARQAIYDYTTLGGRLLASHWHHRWFSDGPDPWPDVATFADRENPQTPATATINTAFPKGQALAEWLVNVGAATTYGELTVVETRDNVQAVNPTYATEWARVNNENQSNSPAILNFRFDTPLDVPPDMTCGRVGFTDVHVLVPYDVIAFDSPGDPFPGHCAVRDLSPQEKLLEFMLFDLTSCAFQSALPFEPPGR
jgi:hypothetical protein